MNRLTKSFNGEYYYKDANTIIFDNELNYNVVQKLGKLEDIEEELGCPLEVVFKALRTGICIKDEQYLRLPDFGLYNEKFALYAVGANNSMKASLNTFYTKDYQKTWWLKGEKNEDN